MSLMHGRRLVQLAASACLIVVCGCSVFGGRPADPTSLTSDAQRKEWWKSNKHLAVFTPGRGYSIEGVPGYFDAKGRPMEGGGSSSGVKPADYTVPAVAANDDAEEETWLEYLDPIATSKRVKDSFKPDADGAAARKLYAEGEALFRKKEYAEAAEKFTEAADRAPGSLMEEDAMLMLAESRFFGDSYPLANDTYAELIKKNSSTRHLDKIIARQFAIAHYWLKYDQASPNWPTTPNLFDHKRHTFDTRGHAMRTFESIWLNDPTGPLADDALFAVANAYFLAGNYSDADYHYGQIRKEFTDSEHQFESHLLGLQCKLRLYQGHDYDATPLEEADQLAEQLLKQFPDKVGDERERIELARKQIAASWAMRDWTDAELHATHKRYGAARYYYKELINKYPGTKIADAARERMKSYQGEPDVPAQQLEWLVNLFPDSKKKTIAIAASPPAGSMRR